MCIFCHIFINFIWRFKLQQWIPIHRKLRRFCNGGRNCMLSWACQQVRQSLKAELQLYINYKPAQSRTNIAHISTEYLYLLKTSSSGRKKSMAKKEKNVSTKWPGGTKAKAVIHHIPTADPANVTGCNRRRTRKIVDQSRSVFFFCPDGVSQISNSIGERRVAQTDRTAPKPYTTESVISQSSPSTISFPMLNLLQILFKENRQNYYLYQSRTLMGFL